MLYKKRINKKWTLPDLLILAKQYSTRSAFKYAHQAAYLSTCRQGLGSQVFAHMQCGNKLRAYNFETLQKIAKKYKTRDEFKRVNRGAYDAARRMNKLEAICKHMPKFATQNRYEEHTLHPQIKKILIKNKVRFDHEFFLNKKAKPDFIIFNKKNQALIIEIKADCKVHEKLELRVQINKYKYYGSKVFKKMFKGVILASETGKYGINFKSLEEKIIHFSQLK